jgi:signal-transduction protein with cAMP-binding, CBS, and nucleotidyltransferase domain
VAALLESKGIKRVPIMKDGKIVGIVSRANLLQGLASTREKAIHTPPDDTSIRDNVMRSLAEESWARPSLLNVTVHDGIVDLWGLVESQT